MKISRVFRLVLLGSVDHLLYQIDGRNYVRHLEVRFLRRKRSILTSIGAGLAFGLSETLYEVVPLSAKVK